MAKKTLNTTKNTEQENDLKLNIKEYLIHLFDIKAGTNKAGTIQDIKDGISIKGHTAWVLIFSILIASIGLNVSSTAVVIGAMLIAPLMGPLLGVGLSIATNDVHTLKNSLVNLGAMTAISLLTSFLFFSIPLFQEETPELLARTKPDLRDVLIAIAGGFALIVSLSRRKEMTNTLAGVAIATALMPPLCTAGYGLAIGNWNFFAGAMFLFIINSTFIAMATFVILKFLRFRKVQKVKTAKQKLIIRLASFIALLILVGSIFTSYKLVQKQKFTKSAQTFVDHIKEKGFSIIDKDSDDFDFNRKIITVTIFGKRVSISERKEWEAQLVDLGLLDTKLIIEQADGDTEIEKKMDKLQSTYADQIKFISQRDENIKNKEITIQQLKEDIQLLYANRIPFQKISKEAQINYEGLRSLSYANRVSTNFRTTDTIAVFTTQWYDSIPNTDQQFDKLKIWLKTRLDLDTLEVIK
ncbi:MAG TPA: DUF389 domain-containing protein [Lutibacter sp.]|nr:DUF389 domain-containing protein [Lutibacter sp.]